MSVALPHNRFGQVITMQAAISKINLVYEVINTGVLIIHDSYLSKTIYWPKNGVRAGWGSSRKLEDLIYYVVNTNDWDQIE